MTTDSKRSRSCPECGGTEIAEGVRVTQTAEAGSVGLSYKAWGPLRGTEPLLADVCRRCGTVVRFFVKEPDKPWISE